MRHVITATIDNGESLSGEVDLTRHRIRAIHMPSAWTAANLTFQAAAYPSGTFNDVYDDAGNELQITAAASRAILLTSDADKQIANLGVVKIRSGTTGAPVNQDAARTLSLEIETR